MGFDFTIAIAPNDISLNREMQYIKAALLYADSITLISPMAYLYFQLSDEKYQLNEKLALHLINQVLPFVQKADPQWMEENKPILMNLEKLIYSKQYKNLTMLNKIELKRVLKNFAIKINETLKESMGNTFCSDLSKLIDKKIINLKKLDHSLDDSNGLIYEYYDLLKESILTSYPLFDEQSNSLMRAAVNDHIINLSDIDKQRITHAGLSDNYIERLPTFSKSPIDEILDIKRELSKPLVRFRSKMLQYSETIQSLPWDNDFKNECNHLYYKEIAPAILEIEEMKKDNSFIKNLSYNIITDHSALLFAIAAAGVISSFSTIASLDSSILAAGGSLGAAKIASTFKEYRQKQKELERNDIYFYYRAGKMLE